MKTTNDFPTINERPPEGRKDDGTSFRVLVVDDSMFVAKQLGQILSSEGYEIIATAADGKKVLINTRNSVLMLTL
jgi:two-component system chemotaxis response regulator CheY